MMRHLHGELLAQLVCGLYCKWRAEVIISETKMQLEIRVDFDRAESPKMDSLDFRSKIC